MSTTKRPRATGSAQIDSLKTKGRSAAAGSAALTQTKPRGGHLVATFLDSKGHISVGRVARRFGMSKVQLAETIGLKPETIYRAARLEAPKTQTRATEMLEIIGRIADWAGGEKQAMAWYRAEPIAAFGGRTAESLVKDGKASAVRDYLDHVATGGFA
jgi:ribosome-binding protein aMBF1 (putative translation factor)